MMLTPDEITQYVHKQIPITSAMGIKIVDYCRASARATAPLAENINHQDSAFGGSIATLGIVTGWVTVWASLRANDRSPTLVIQHSETEFSKPALDTMESESRPLSEAAIKEFLGGLDRKGTARILVTSDIFSGGNLVAKNTGTFVAVAKRD